MIDLHTLGGSPAAEIIVDKLNKMNDNVITKKVTSAFGQYSEGIHEIRRGIKNKRVKEKMFQLWHDSNKKKFVNLKLFQKT